MTNATGTTPRIEATVAARNDWWRAEAAAQGACDAALLALAARRPALAEFTVERDRIYTARNSAVRAASEVYEAATIEIERTFQ